MPTSIRTKTSIQLRGSGITLEVVDDNSYGCRDEWLYVLGVRVRDNLQEIEPFDRFTEVDATLLLKKMLPDMIALCSVSVGLLNTITQAEARALAEEVLDRYANVNPNQKYVIEEIFDRFSRSPRTVITFIGNHWTVAAAWWFILAERLRHDIGHIKVIDILNASDPHDEAHWYDTEDRHEHIELWNQGRTAEPSPLVWIGYQAGPIYTAEQTDFEVEVAV